jgi:hypothetical protein
MTWVQRIVEQLAAAPMWGYDTGGTPMSEPTAWAALALAAHGKLEAAERACDWLYNIRSPDGSVGISMTETTPQWPTALAVMAWRAFDAAATEPKYTVASQAAINWMLTLKGKPAERSGDAVGHDTTLIGWPWVESTHSWLEPTAWAVLALKSCGMGAHPRAREGVRVMIDRLLPEGGCNYGNTYVLGQKLVAHLEPTGLILTALAGENDSSGRLQKTITFAADSIGPTTTAQSLSYVLIGLAAHGRLPSKADAWLEASATLVRQRPSTQLRLALMAVAALGARGPLVRLPFDAKPLLSGVKAAPIEARKLPTEGKSP